jgi:hypothetical protein
MAEGGHDVETVLSEGLSGRSDEVIYDVCLRERRKLITLDLDSTNPMRFPPLETEGIVVLRPPRAVLPQIRAVLVHARNRIVDGTVKGRLWIVEPGRIRIRQPK